MPTRYLDETLTYPDSNHQLMSGAEESVEYLIELGDKHGVDMKTVLDETTKCGETMFHKATWLSEKLSKHLLQRGVKTNTVNSSFMTPIFRVS